MHVVITTARFFAHSLSLGLHLFIRSKETHCFGSIRGAAPFRWKTPSTNTPFLPLHIIKKFNASKYISMCLLDIKLLWPILTSTSPLLEFLPITTRFVRTMYSNSFPSSLAMGFPFLSGDQFKWWRGEVGVLFWRANNAQACWSGPFSGADIVGLSRRRWRLGSTLDPRAQLQCQNTRYIYQ